MYFDKVLRLTLYYLTFPYICDHNQWRNDESMVPGSSEGRTPLQGTPRGVCNGWGGGT